MELGAKYDSAGVKILYVRNQIFNLDRITLYIFERDVRRHRVTPIERGKLVSFERLSQSVLKPIDPLQRLLHGTAVFPIICLNRCHTVAYNFGVARVRPSVQRQSICKSSPLGTGQRDAVGIKVMRPEAELA